MLTQIMAGSQINQQTDKRNTNNNKQIQKKYSIRMQEPSQGPQQLQNISSGLTPPPSILQMQQTKYTTNQFYPKNRTKLKNSESPAPKSKLTTSINKSTYSQKAHTQKPPQLQPSSPLYTTSQTYDFHSNQQKRQSQHSSFTMKIIDHHLMQTMVGQGNHDNNNNRSNLIGRKESIEIDKEGNGLKVRSRLYDQIEMINKREERIRPVAYDLNVSEKLKSKKRKQSPFQKQSTNLILSQEEQGINQLYKSLPQPFINKKQLSSFDAPSNYFKPTQKDVKEHQRFRLNQQKTKELKLLQINNVKQRNHQSISDMIEQLTKFSYDANSIVQNTLTRRSKYKKKKLEPLKVNVYKEKMSNNIKDYLSVERIKIKEMETQLLPQLAHTLNHEMSIDSAKEKENPEKNSQSQSQSPIKPLSRKTSKPYSTVGTLTQHRAKPVKFVPPFSLYYYRDFIWKVGFSNEFIVQTPTDYETKIKVYLGKGNNSNLIRGLIKRRPWYQITEKYQEAHFVWTQIKIQAFFGLQKKSEKVVEFQQIDSPLIENAKNILPLNALNQIEKAQFLSYWTRNISKQMKFKQNLKNRSRAMNLKQFPINQISPNMKIHNHFVNNYVIGNKKALFSLMNKFYTEQNEQVFNYLPLTFHIKNGLEDDEYLKFLNYFYSISKQIKKMEQSVLSSYIYKHNAWIVKPGENTNRGNGIIVCLNLNEVKAILKKKEKHNDGTYKTYILQKYIQKPLLYRKRKFDLRHYMMMSCTNGIVKGYWYKEGYVRTTSAEYTLKFNSGGVHLTNDAVQKQLPDYGKFEKGNKISYQELHEYIKKNDPEFDFFAVIMPKMKKIASDLIRASAKLMDPQKKQNNFEIFGLDFMIDQAYNVWLIECNSNPCLELSCPLLGRIIPKMVQNVFRICLDPIFVPPLNFAPKCQEYYENINEENRFELVYDERTDIATKHANKGEANEFLENKDFQQEDDTFDDDGEAWDD